VLILNKQEGFQIMLEQLDCKRRICKVIR